MCLKALGHVCDEDEVNKVMGATPMKGAAWEHALACAQHYGCRATLTCPSTVAQLKSWTDQGIPVMIAWNPEGREWSHASVVFDVDDDGNVWVADPNIPDPDETVRIVPKSEFYKLWYEKWPRYLVRRPALAIEREITPEGRQVMAAKQEIPGGLARNKKPGDFDPGQLAMGIKVEKEHLVGDGYSDSEMHNMAEEIAMDHLIEIPDYYTRLKRMEEAAKTASARRVVARFMRHAFGDAQLWAGRRRATADEIEFAKNAEWQEWTPQPLPADLYRYFKRAPGAIEVKLKDLTPIRAREKGIANANRFMWLAYWGAMPVRKPISLKDNGDGTYTVLDGNSTFANAKMSKWDKIVGVVE